MEGRRIRRMVGFLAARLPELDLDAVEDPRAREGKWSLAQILRATLLGLMAGCKGLREMERLTADLSIASRRQMGLKRRLSDTTARDALCEVSNDDLRAVLHRVTKAAQRRKALEPDDLPLSVVALDGKTTSLPCINQRLIQTQHPEIGLPYGLARTMTAALVSAAGRPCIDSYGDGKEPHESIWPHAKAFLRVDYVKVKHGEIVEQDDRMYVCSLDPDTLSTEQWLRLVRRHWAVENNNHNTLDSAFAEDRRPWIEADGNGMLAVLILRRIAYTLLALFRASLRTEENRAMPWRDLMHWLQAALMMATAEHATNLRRRELCAAAR